mgnify:CR=1 FL=1
MGIDYAIHYVSMLRRERWKGSPDPNGAALDYVGTPILANALGLAVGFTALLLSPLQMHTTLTILIWTTMTASAVLSLTLLPTITTRPGTAGAPAEHGDGAGSQRTNSGGPDTPPERAQREDAPVST